MSKGKALGRRGEYRRHGLLGKSRQKLTHACDSAGCFPGWAPVRGPGVRVRSLQAAWSNKTDAKEAAMPCSSLAKLSTYGVGIYTSIKPLKVKPLWVRR